MCVPFFVIMKAFTTYKAERERFELSRPLRACRISSAVPSTTQPPLRFINCAAFDHSAVFPHGAYTHDILLRVNENLRKFKDI